MSKKLKIRRAGAMVTDYYGFRCGELALPFKEKCEKIGVKRSEVLRTFIVAWLKGEIEVE